MPTPESAEAFIKLTSAREKLTNITKQLNEAHAQIPSGGQQARRLHAELQEKWEEAFRAFELATEEFSAAVKHAHDELTTKRAAEGN
jgi:F0F1-type ATP synthase membrane subunit b/b'